MATQKGRNWSSGDIVTAANLSSIERGVSAVAEEYTPTTWANGDTVTAAALNNIEQGIANASNGDSWVTLAEESVTTAIEQGASAAIGLFAYSERITADTIKVTFNGTEYTCNKIDDEGAACYGAFDDFSEYPFLIESSESGNYLDTETTGTYSIKIEAPAGGGSSDFSTATVTVINDSSDGVTMSGAFFDEGAVYGAVYGEELSAPGTQEMSLIVYKNASSELYFDLGTTIITTITGDATQRGSAYVDVTGDCTITVS